MTTDDQIKALETLVQGSIKAFGYVKVWIDHGEGGGENIWATPVSGDCGGSRVDVYLCNHMIGIPSWGARLTVENDGGRLKITSKEAVRQVLAQGWPASGNGGGIHAQGSQQT